MWLTIYDEKLPSAVRAILSTDGKWYLLASDASRLMESRLNFHNDRILFHHCRIKDIVTSDIWSDMPEDERHLSVVDLTSLERLFYPDHPSLAQLRKLFCTENAKVDTVSWDPAIECRMNNSVQVSVIDDDSQCDSITMQRFLRKFKKRTMKIYGSKRMEAGSTRSALNSADAPPEITVTFKDGAELKYRRI